MPAGKPSPAAALFFHTGQAQRSSLAEQLGCGQSAKGALERDEHGCTTTRGVYVAGEACVDPQLAIVAASEGAKAARAMNRKLLEDEVGEEPSTTGDTRR